MFPLTKAIFLLSVVYSSYGAPAAPVMQAPPSVRTVPKAYIIEFEDSPVIDGGSVAAVEQSQSGFMQAMVTSEVHMEVRQKFDTLFNGISVSVNSPSDINKIAASPNVKAIWPVVKIPLPEVINHGDIASQPDLRFSHNLTGVNYVHSKLGLTGKGIKVGIIDSGIDYKHPALGGCFGQGCKVAFGYDFVGNNYTGANPPVPDDDPMDCGGHGTHVAGIVGAKDKDFVGVAPEVTLGAYRVFGCEGSTSNDVIISALERAYKDNMDLINMSLGHRNGWPESPDAVVASKLAAKGMIAIASIGNEGAYGLLQAGSPGVGKNVVGVASFDNAYFKARSFKLGKDGVKEIPFSESPQFPAKKEFLAEILFSADNKDGCKDYPEKFFEGKTALIQRGTCMFVEKAKRAQAAGAKSVIIFNNVAKIYFDLTITDPSIKIPMFGISLEDGNYLVEETKGGKKVTLELVDVEKGYPNPTSGKISVFSSWGLSPELEIKPDLGAPGGFILSTFPRAKGSYATLSGTSMSSPYLSGVVALYLQKHGNTKFDDLRTVLQNTALPVTEAKFDDYKTSVARQGAGLVQADRAIQRDFVVTPSSLALGLKTSMTQKFTIQDLNGKGRRNFKISHEFSVAVNAANLDQPVLRTYPSKVTFSRKRLHVNAGASDEFEVTITPNPHFKASDHYIYGGYITVTALNDKKELTEQMASIPFTGYSGDYLSRPLIEKGQGKAPHITLLKHKAAGADEDEKEEYTHANSTDAVFRFDEGDLLSLEFSLSLASREITYYLINTKDGSNMGVISTQTQLQRNVPKDPISEFQWDGLMRDGLMVPKGKYQIQMSALKSPADPRDKSSYDTWTSTPFSILRSTAFSKPK